MYEEIITSTSPLIHCLWRAVVEDANQYTDSAHEYWGLAFTRHLDNTLSAELVGPTLLAQALAGHAGEEYWGVEFNAHVVMHGVDKQAILGTTTPLQTKGTQFFLGGYAYDIPQYEELETMVQSLSDKGIITGDAVIRRALAGDTSGLSERSWQRHFRHTTGLTKKQITQLQRARHAFFLLQSGITPAEVAMQAGYADQAHMTRSLQLIRSETPAYIIASYMKSK